MCFKMHNKWKQCFKIISKITSKSESIHLICPKSLDWLWLSSTSNQGQKSGQSCSLFQPSVLLEAAMFVRWTSSHYLSRMFGTWTLRSVYDFSVTFSSFPPYCGTWSVSLVRLKTNSGRASRVCGALTLIVLATYFKYLPSADTERSRFGIKCFI